MTWAVGWWLGLSLAWTLGFVTAALLARRREVEYDRRKDEGRP